MKTPDEIKKGLECCLFGKCRSCPYSEEYGCDCSEHLRDDIREYHNQLEAERDAAVADMYEMVLQPGFIACDWCDHCECESDCSWSSASPGFKWRGAQKEDGR